MQQLQIHLAYLARGLSLTPRHDQLIHNIAKENGDNSVGIVFSILNVNAIGNAYLVIGQNSGSGCLSQGAAHSKIYLHMVIFKT